MAILVQCTCGKSYNLKDEFAGRSVRCPSCGTTLEVPASGTEAADSSIDPAFNRDKFLLRQKHLSINEKYFVWDENQNHLLFVERKTHLGRGCLAILGGIIPAMLVFGLFAGGAAATQNDTIIAIGIVVGIFAAIATLVIVATALAPKRHIQFYRDENRGEKLLEALQDKKFQIIHATYTVLDAAGQPIAYLDKNNLYNLFRKQWRCTVPGGAELCYVLEDSMVLALLRRVLGTFFGLLRTNYIIIDPTRVNVLGEFNRRLAILDRYVLDMSRDSGRQIDRRIAVAIGVLLDTGERR